MISYAAIDPGKHGGIAWIDESGRIHCESLPPYDKQPGADHARDLTQFLGRIHSQTWIVENVGFHRPGNAGPSSVKLGRQVGIILGVLAALGKDIRMVAPQTWMRKLPGLLPKEYTARKNAILDMMLDKHPEAFEEHPTTKKFRYSVADAVAMLSVELDASQPT